MLRLAKVTADGNREFDVHFGEQKSPVFLVDKPGSHAAQFFASSSDTASLIEMQKRHQQKMVDARRERMQLQTVALKLAIDLDALAATDQINVSVGQAESQYQELEQLTSSIGPLTQDISALDQVISLQNHHRAEAIACATLMLPPALENPQPLADVIGAMSRTQSDLQRQSACAVSLWVLPTIPDLADERLLAELIEHIQSAELISLRLEGQCITTRDLFSPPVMIEFERLQITVAEVGALSGAIVASQQRFAVLSLLVPSPKLDDEGFLFQDLKTLSRAWVAVQFAEAAHSQLQALVAVPKWVDTCEIDGAIVELDGAAFAVSTRNQDLIHAEMALHEGENLLRNWARQQQLCPTCGGKLDPNLIVVHAGSCVGDSQNA